jgi:uncharacterized membrane protein YphA (DoxX/SURF4 family)
MLSLFPSLFDYSALAVGVLRFVVGILFIVGGYKYLSQKGAEKSLLSRFLSGTELAGGVLLLAGLFTQAVAVVLGIAAFRNACAAYKKEPREEKLAPFYLLLSIISISFLFLGPGLWSIDYPL